jgi:hypothetical protein
MDHEETVFRQLVGFYKHFCPDWDLMAIDEYCPEFEACTCDKTNTSEWVQCLT